MGLQRIVINESVPGAGIGWHCDKAMFEDVIAASLQNGRRVSGNRALISGPINH
jgi:alkylated DNA repair dioxygenase AlkB